MPEHERRGLVGAGTVRIEGGSVGFQIGGSSTDLVMLVMNERGADKLLAEQVHAGRAKAPAAAGPVGRTATAQTDAQMHADILSWSRTRGLFAGSRSRAPRCARTSMTTPRIYGKRLENRAIVTKSGRVPKPPRRLIELLNRYSVKEQTN